VNVLELIMIDSMCRDGYTGRIQAAARELV
jgi:hypothetical protein